MEDVTRGEWTISDDPIRLDRTLIHHFLSEESYWASGRPLETVERSIESSLCFGVYRDYLQIGFARVVTDSATFAWVCDVFIVVSERGQGLGTWLMETVLAHPGIAGLRRVLLATEDARAVYERVGFEPLDRPDRFMEIFRR